MPGLPNWLPGHVLGVGTATPVVLGRRRVHFQKTRQLWLLGTSWWILLWSLGVLLPSAASGWCPSR